MQTPQVIRDERPVIEAVLFDFGGVFTESPFGAIRAASVERGMDPDVVLDVVFGPYDRDTDHPWHRLERGELPFAEARAAIVASAAARGLELDPFELMSGITRGPTPIEALVERTRAVQARGVRTALVTNNIREFGEVWRQMLPVDELFHVVVDSSVVGARKPDPRIYRVALERLEVLPQRTAFLDDFEGNVEAARRLGMHGILVGRDRVAAFDALDALLG